MASNVVQIPKYWAVNKLGDTEAELVMYGEIEDEHYWGDENSVTPKLIEGELKGLGDGVNKIHVRLNSPGGSVFAGIAIRAILKNFKAKKIVHIEGLAASIATIIMTAGDEIIAEKGSMIMIHKSMTMPWDFLNADELRKHAERLDKIDASLASFYSEKTGKTTDEIMDVLNQGDAWFTDEEALEFGLIDKINGASGKKVAAFMKNKDVAVINGIEMNFSRFSKAPALPVAQVNEEPEEEPEQQTNEGEKEIMNIEELKSKHPDIYAQVIKEGVQKERGRIVALNKIGADFPGAESIIAKAVENNEDESWTYREIAMMQKVAVATATATIEADVAGSGVKDVAVDGAEDLKDNAGAKAKAEAEKEGSKKMVDGVKGYLAKLQK